MEDAAGLAGRVTVAAISARSLKRWRERPDSMTSGSSRFGGSTPVNISPACTILTVMPRGARVAGGALRVAGEPGPGRGVVGNPGDWRGGSRCDRLHLSRTPFAA